MQKYLEWTGTQTQAALAGVLRRTAANWRKKHSRSPAVETHSLAWLWKLDRQMNYNWDIGSSFLFQSADTEGKKPSRKGPVWAHGFRYRLHHFVKPHLWCVPGAASLLATCLQTHFCFFLPSVHSSGLLPLYSNEKKRLGYPGLCD